MIEERAHLLSLDESGFELAEISFPRVDGLGCVRVRTNLYSVPAPAGKTVEVELPRFGGGFGACFQVIGLISPTVPCRD